MYCNVFSSWQVPKKCGSLSCLFCVFQTNKNYFRCPSRSEQTLWFKFNSMVSCPLYFRHRVRAVTDFIWFVLFFFIFALIFWFYSGAAAEHTLILKKNTCTLSQAQHFVRCIHSSICDSRVKTARQFFQITRERARGPILSAGQESLWR